MPSAPQFSPRLRDVREASFDTLNRYWNEPDFRRRMDAETIHARQLMKAEWDARLIATDNRFPSNWTAQEKHDTIERMMK